MKIHISLSLDADESVTTANDPDAPLVDIQSGAVIYHLSATQGAIVIDLGAKPVTIQASKKKKGFWGR